MESSIKSLRLNAKNIKSTLISGNKALKKIRADEKSFLAKQNQEQKKINRENFIEGKKKVSGKMGAIGKRLAAPALGFIDKLKEFFGTILLGLAITNIPILIKKVQTWLEENEDLINTVKAVISGFGSALQVLVNIFTTGQPGTSLEDLQEQNKELQKAKKEFADGGPLDKELDGLVQDTDGLEGDFREEFKEQYTTREPEQVREDVVTSLPGSGLTIKKLGSKLDTFSTLQTSLKDNNTLPSGYYANTGTVRTIPGVGSYTIETDKVLGFSIGNPYIVARDVYGTKISTDDFAERVSAVGGKEGDYSELLGLLESAGFDNEKAKLEGYSQGGSTTPARQGATGEEKIARRDTSTFLDLKTSAIIDSQVLKTREEINNTFSKTLEHFKSYLTNTALDLSKLNQNTSPYTLPSSEHQGPTAQLPAPDPNAKGSVITFDSEQGRDRSGEPGVDFSFADIFGNYSIFPGKVVEVGSLYGSGYGRHVTVRSVDQDGKEFDALYAHFGRFSVKEGDTVQSGDYLGTVGWDPDRNKPVPGAGNMTGPHTSVDFYEPNTRRGQVTPKYSGAYRLSNLIINHANKDVKTIQLGAPVTTKPGEGGSSVTPLTPFQKKHFSGGKGGLTRAEQLTQTFDGEGMTDVVIINSTQPIIVPGPTRYIRR